MIGVGGVKLVDKVTVGGMDFDDVIRSFVLDVAELDGIDQTAMLLNGDTHGRLEEKMASLKMPPLAGKPKSSLAKRISGNLYHLPEHEGPIQAVGLETGKQTALLVRIDGQDYPVRYIGIDAPELDEPLGPRAAAKNTELRAPAKVASVATVSALL